MSPRVLCIEGDERLRARVRRALESEGFDVDESTTGLAGIERALNLPPDLVIADVHLPDIEGYELATRLKQEGTLKNVPFVAVGHSPAEHDVAIAAGCDGFLEELDIDDRRLGGELRAYLAGKRERLPEGTENQGLKALSASLAVRLETAVAGATRAAARLEELDKLKSAFMHNLAHELSTPLTPLAGYLKIFQSGKIGALTPQQARIVESMVAAVTRLTRIVDNLSDFASLEAGQSPLLSSRVDPDALADEVVAELRGPIKEARLHVVVAKAGGEPVAADARKLRQALSNLVSNAVKFSPHGGEVLVEVHRDLGRLRYAVYDQGPGIDLRDMEMIFEPFHHATRQEHARPPGSGLGLPVARRIAEAHGGRIVVESPPHTQPGHSSRHYTGSKFVLEIPAEPARAATPQPPPARVG